ncbi:MAG TPA: NAD-dependent epimerase/dehydratase family protein [Devosiaceae bacterium]|nr:NAD-dependent epimerase/dehydratase family protein [Devosiaceae bacterium]
MADKVLVTGISGFLGGHVALALLDSGYAVRGSVRDLARADKVRAALKKHSASGRLDRLEIVSLDLTRDEGWREAAEGCRFVQHVASPLALKAPKDRDELIGPAVGGTRRALAAGLAADVERIVLTSSIAAIVYGHDRNQPTPFTEADWSNPQGQGVTAYSESKTRAELEAWTIMESLGRRSDLAVINPTVILGPLLDADPGFSGVMVQRLLNGSVPAAARFYFGVVDVRNVAEMHVRAMEIDTAGGRRFIASAGTLSLLEGAKALRQAFPERAAKIPGFELPDWAVRLYAPFDSDLRENIDSLGVVRQVDNRAGAALLGHPYISPAEAAIAMGSSLIMHQLV